MYTSTLHPYSCVTIQLKQDASSLTNTTIIGLKVISHSAIVVYVMQRLAIPTKSIFFSIVSQELRLQFSKSATVKPGTL